MSDHPAQQKGHSVTESPTPLLDALEALRRGRDDPGFEAAWVYVFEVLEAKKNTVLRSFPQECRDYAADKALDRLLQRERPFESRIEGAAHAYVHKTLRSNAIDWVRRRKPPQPPRPPSKVRPRKGSVLDGVRAETEDVAMFFEHVVPVVLARYAAPPPHIEREKLVSPATLAIALNELRSIAEGSSKLQEADADRREALRRKYQRTIKVLRLLVPEIWETLGWSPVGVFSNSIGELITLEDLWMMVQSRSDCLSKVSQTLAAVVELSRAFHVIR